MTMKCDACNKDCYCAHMTPDHKKLCGECYDKNRHKWDRWYDRAKKGDTWPNKT